MDESPYTVSGSTRFRVWRLPNERYKPVVTRATIKHSERINVWGCFAAHGVGKLYRVPGIMDHHEYHRILQHQLKPSLAALFGKKKCIFQQDNDPKHTAKINKQYLANLESQGKLTWLEWPSQSPDLNPIENLWAIIERQLATRNCYTQAELFDLLREQWESLPTSLLKTLSDSMPHRCQAVIDAKGYPTKY